MNDVAPLPCLCTDTYSYLFLYDTWRCWPCHMYCHFSLSQEAMHDVSEVSTDNYLK